MKSTTNSIVKANKAYFMVGHKSEMIRNECNKISSGYLERLDPEDLKFRPIVPGTACETHRFSKLVDTST